MSNLNYISKLAPYSNNVLQMIMVQKILSYLLLINVALLVLLINDGKSSATGFPSVTLRANGDFVLPEKLINLEDKARESWLIIFITTQKKS